jgi:protein TonB
MEIVGDRPAQAAKPAAAGRTPQKIRVGGSVQATKMVKMVRPSYPEGLKAQGVEGDVLLEAVISKEGKLLNVRSLNTNVNPDLVAAAVDAVKQWEYQPTLLNGEPVEVITTIHIGFHLK